MQLIPRDEAKKYSFDWREEAQLSVRPGETFEIETWDASSGYFKSEADKAVPGKRAGFDRTPVMANPMGGPVFVEGAERGDTLRERNRRGRFKRVTQRGVMGAKVDRFGPRFPQQGIVNWPDDAGGGRRSTVDGEGFVDGAERADGLEHGFGEAAGIFGVELVKIEAGGLPILVQTEREIERRLTLQPCDVGTRLRCAEIEVVAVKVETGGAFTGAKGEPGGIKLGTDEPCGPAIEDPGLDHAQQRLGWSRFVSVDSRG